MKHIAWMLISLFLLPLCAHAGLPADYAPQSLDRALAQSARDGKPVMLYFTEDW